MIELSVADCDEVGGGVLPLIVSAIFGMTTLLGASGTLYDFASGALDGFNGIR